MTETEASPVLGGCDLSVLDSTACQRYLAWMIGENEATAPEGATGLDWALAHCDDGVTWGRYDAAAAVWLLGNQVAPEISPPIHQESLQELRMFGETSEVLIWRTDEGLQGRVLQETDPPTNRKDTSNPLRPSDEPRVVRGDEAKPYNRDFTRVWDRAGAEQVLPLATTTEQLRAAQVRLTVRHYYESDADTGMVRIAATRLVALTSGGAYDD